MERHDRAIGCLLGQAIGDAVGTLCEFEDSVTATHIVKKYIKDNGQLSLIGQYDGRQYNAQITDDTEMALALARSIIRKKRYDIYDVTQSYVTWFNTDPIDLGNSTTRAFSQCKIDYTAEHNYQLVTQSAQKLNVNSLSNGCIMRAAPLGIAGVQWDINELCRVGRLDCQLTNPNLVAQEAVCAYICAIKTGIETGDVNQTIQAAINQSNKDSIVQKTLITATELSTFNKIPLYLDNRMLYVRNDTAYQGYLGINLFNAFHELSHTHDFMDIIKNIMCRGGDTDTNCAVAAALYGAVHGYQNIPKHLIHEITTRPYMRAGIYPWGQTHDIAKVALALTKF